MGEAQGRLFYTDVQPFTVAEPGFDNARLEIVNQQLELAHRYFEEKFYDRETKVRND